MITDRVDLILQYALLRAGDEDSSADRGLGPIHLLKYVYLADLAHARMHDGATFTGTAWKFHHFGPWAVGVHQRIEPAMRAIQASRQEFGSDYEDRDNWVRWSKTDERLLREKQQMIPIEIRSSLDILIHKFKKDTPVLLDHVYRTAPMLSAAPGTTLDFKLEQPFSRSTETVASTPVRTARQIRKLKESAKEMRAKHMQRSSTETRFVPKAAPQDEVYEAGIAWLDSLAGEPFRPQTITVEFAPEVWDSQARRSDDLS